MSRDATSRAAGSPADPDDDLDADVWDDEAEVGTELAPNLFSDEIESLDASDWEVDSALIWGDQGDAADAGGFDILI